MPQHRTRHSAEFKAFILRKVRKWKVHGVMQVSPQVFSIMTALPAACSVLTWQEEAAIRALELSMVSPKFPEQLTYRMNLI